MHRFLARAAATALLVISLAACGEDDDPAANPSPSASPTDTSPPTTAPSTAPSTAPIPSAKPTPTIPADAPRCATVWAAGSTLPGNYKGCVTGHGKGRAYERAAALSCSSGQGIVRFDNRFWAVRGGTIHEAPKITRSDEYLAAVARCRG